MSVTYNSEGDTYELRGVKFRVEAEKHSDRTHLRIVRASDGVEMSAVDAFLLKGGPAEVDYPDIGPEIPMHPLDATAIHEAWRGRHGEVPIRHAERGQGGEQDGR
ncbi:hypothetical protein [Sorangium sp. So ce1335]|uniref:hypothetical protein n=1 Tax=Sorangium sp. So ce1335 TaxID=3133335 RepID=UPI003F6179FB